MRKQDISIAYSSTWNENKNWLLVRRLNIFSFFSYRRLAEEYLEAGVPYYIIFLFMVGDRYSHMYFYMVHAILSSNSFSTTFLVTLPLPLISPYLALACWHNKRMRELICLLFEKKERRKWKAHYGTKERLSIQPRFLVHVHLPIASTTGQVLSIKRSFNTLEPGVNFPAFAPFRKSYRTNATSDLQILWDILTLPQNRWIINWIFMPRKNTWSKKRLNQKNPLRIHLTLEITLLNGHLPPEIIFK